MVKDAILGPCPCRGWKVEQLQAIAAGGHHPKCPRRSRPAAAPAPRPSQVVVRGWR
jgi:hypothetical protein